MTYLMILNGSTCGKRRITRSNTRIIRIIGSRQFRNTTFIPCKIVTQFPTEILRLNGYRIYIELDPLIRHLTHIGGNDISEVCTGWCTDTIEQIFGALVTEKVRSLGAKLVNKNGEVFMHPLETRDVTAASIIRECSERDNGIDCGNGKGVWLDTPMIEKIGGEGTIMKRIPAMWRMFEKYGIDIRKEPILVYPTLHYQNGGLDITDDCMTTNIKNLFVAGEAVGGIHGKNRLMGNSLLDIIVFGRSAGKNAAATAKNTTVGKLTLSHIEKFEKEIADANIQTDVVSPKLLPNYTNQKSI